MAVSKNLSYSRSIVRQISESGLNHCQPCKDNYVTYPGSLQRWWKVLHASAEEIGHHCPMSRHKSVSTKIPETASVQKILQMKSSKFISNITRNGICNARFFYNTLTPQWWISYGWWDAYSKKIPLVIVTTVRIHYYPYNPSELVHINIICPKTK